MNNEFYVFLLIFAFLLLTSILMGKCCEKLHQPKVIGEVIVGILFGKTFFGHFFSDVFHSTIFSNSINKINIVKDLGLVMLMFASGLELRNFRLGQNLRVCAWGVLLGIGIPGVLGFFTLGLFNFQELSGTVQSLDKLNMILLLSMAVTSIPVIARIFIDLKMINTNFAKQILSIALFEDFILYILLNFVINAGAKEADFVGIANELFFHLLISAFFLIIVLSYKDKIFSLLKKMIWVDSLDDYQRIIVTISFLFLSVYFASLIGIASMLSALACGIIISCASSQRALITNDIIMKFSFSIFIPIYFIMVGINMDLYKDFSIYWITVFLLLSSAFKILGGYMAGRMARLFHFDSLAMGLTLNARGGPGIVIATTAFEAGIINAVLFTTLIITALATSSFAGFFLRLNRSKLI
jgi:Kef-type K+ transport system membrane component KefB